MLTLNYDEHIPLYRLSEILKIDAEVVELLRQSEGEEYEERAHSP